MVPRRHSTRDTRQAARRNCYGVSHRCPGVLAMVGHVAHQELRVPPNLEVADPSLRHQLFVLIYVCWRDADGGGERCHCPGRNSLLVRLLFETCATRWSLRDAVSNAA